MFSVFNLKHQGTFGVIILYIVKWKSFDFYYIQLCVKCFQLETPGDTWSNCEYTCYRLIIILTPRALAIIIFLNFCILSYTLHWPQRSIYTPITNFSRLSFWIDVIFYTLWKVRFDHCDWESNHRFSPIRGDVLTSRLSQHAYIPRFRVLFCSPYI